MIDPQVFEQEIAILMDWYNRDFEPATLKRLHQRLSQHLSTEQFVRAAQTVFDTSRFFPTVEEFVSAVKGDAQSLALQEWEVCVLAASRANREMIAGLSPQGQSALQMVGGLYKLGAATEEQLVWIKKEFVGVWKSSSADTLSLPASRASAPIQLDPARRDLFRSRCLSTRTVNKTTPSFGQLLTRRKPLM